MSYRSSIGLFLTISLSEAVTADEGQSVRRPVPKQISEWCEELHVPAVGIGIIEGGRTTSVQVFGELRPGQPAPENTLFNVASQTKAVVAVMVLKLVQEGRWDLDEPLARDWVDPDVANDPRHTRLTTRHVLTHQSGFVNWRTSRPSGQLTFDFEPGQKFQYSGEGFQYLQNALVRRFETPLDVLLETVLLKPLAMHDTRYWGSGPDPQRFAGWHNSHGELYAISPVTGVSAADDLLSTVRDFCTLGELVIGGQGLSPAARRRMFQPQVAVKKDYCRTLGWGRVDGLPQQEYALEHGGSDRGVRTMAVFLPVSQRGIVVMTNADNGLFLIDRIIRASLESGGQILDTISRPENEPQKITLSVDIIERYTGRYRRPDGSVISVVRRDRGIEVSGDGIPTAVLMPSATHRFFWPGVDVRLDFRTTDSGAVTGMTVYEGGQAVLNAVAVP